MMAGHFILESNLAVCFRDSFPINPGHIHVAPRRHEPDFTKLTTLEREDVWRLVDEAVRWLEENHSCDGINIGINVGEAAGQTVPHTSVHLIPRHLGDVEDPRGGVRLVHPERGPYHHGRT